MIDLRELDLIEDDGYEIWKLEDGTILKVGLPSQKDLIRITKIQYLIQEVQTKYNAILNKKTRDENDFDTLDKLYRKLIDTIYGLFLFILNLNTRGKVFTLEDIERIPLTAIQSECDGYVGYVRSKLKN